MATQQITWARPTAADTSKDGTGANTSRIMTADATFGSLVHKVRIQPTGNCPQTVVRLWINNGQATGNANNNSLWQEVAIPATSTSEQSANAHVDVDMEIKIPPGFRLYYSVAAVGDAYFHVTAIYDHLTA